MVSAFEVIYLGVIGTLIGGFIYVTFVEVFNTGFKIKIGGVRRSGREKKKKKAITTKTKTKNT
ncbi:hypothetical protein DDW09_01985 [Sulfolobus sp. SCGC AB-777_L09]|nr:hypothetical protein [Sulfolobaceae archaeon]PVU70645.1 hypothetical protein DDW09_01985 [Sulfolobus sp. SCGC AB-777_L09]